MRTLLKGVGMTLFTVMFCIGLSTVALSVDREVYDKPDVQQGKVIKGKVVNVVKLDEKSVQPSWHVYVKDQETGEVVLLHVDKGTTRKDIMLSPDLGDNVIAKYNERNHALSLLTDQAISH